MSSYQSFCETVEATFEEEATEEKDDDTKMLHAPGVDGLHTFLASCRSKENNNDVDADSLSLEAVEKAFEENGWSHDMDFKKEDVMTLLESLGFELPAAEADEDEDLAQALAEIADDLAKRKSANEFPLLRTEHMNSKDAVTDAKHCISLVDEEDHVKIQSYIDYQKQKYLESNPGDPALSIDEQHAQWALQFYYKHLRDFLAQESLDTHKFVHRFSGDAFVSLIPWHSLAQTKDRNDAQKAIKLMKPAYLTQFDKALWSAWALISPEIEKMGLDKYTTFREFLDDDYFRVMHESCSTCAEGDLPPLAFEPLVDPSFGASADELVLRKTWISKAAKVDHEKASEGVNREYAAYLKTVSRTARKRLPAKAPAKFAAEAYYRLLKERMESSNAANPSQKNEEASEAKNNASASTDVNVNDAFDSIMMGDAFGASACSDEELKYQSAATILHELEDGARCNYQGAVVMCEDFPREISYADGSPRKRKASASEGKAADVIFTDKTGPVGAIFWNEFAEEICSIWRNVKEKRSQGVKLACVIDLTQMRVQGIPNNKWNGESITRMRTLTSVEGVGNDGGTKINHIPQGTASNLTSLRWVNPTPECCVSSFRNLRKKLVSPFRLTIRGKIVDLQPLERSAGGNMKRVFDIVDPHGLYISCCAMKHNAEASCLRNYQEVIGYWGLGRSPIGSSKGMLYFMKDAIIVAAGDATKFNTAKNEQLFVE